MRLSHWANPLHWRARYVLWATWLAFAAVIWWGVDTYLWQYDRDVEDTKALKSFAEEEEILQSKGRDLADEFIGNLIECQNEQAWSKFSTIAQHQPQLRQELDRAIKYLEGKPAITRPKVTLWTGMRTSHYWVGGSTERRPSIICSFYNADPMDAPFFIQFRMILEVGLPRIEKCSVMTKHRTDQGITVIE
jgi:hypothetical protein